MGRRRIVIILWRRLRRPGLGGFLAASLTLHLLLFLLMGLLPRGGLETPAPREPLIVELPPAEPGRPRTPAPPPAVAARPAPAPKRLAPPAERQPPARVAEAPKPPPEPPAPVPRAVEPPPPVREVAPTPSPSPPAVAKAPEPPRPEPPAPQVPERPVPAEEPREPSPEPARQVARVPEPSPPSPPASARPSAPEVTRPTPGPPPEGAEGEPPAFLEGRRFSLLRPRLELPPLPGEGGVKEEGTGAGEAGTSPRGQVPIPLSTPDPRYQDYFQELKRRIEEHLVYPSEAARQRQAGQLLLAFVIRRDGSLRTVELQHSSGFPILDQFSLRTVQLAAPFPPIPIRIPEETLFITASFTYTLTTDFRSLWLR